MSTSEYPAQRVSGPRLPRLRAAVAARELSWDVWVVVALTLIATAIRIIVIDNQSYWTDEALTAYEAHLPFGAMLNTVAHVETTPPLYFVLIWAWAHIFGTGEVALRSVSTIAGIAIVPLAYLCARELISRWAGVIAAALVALNPFMIWYSQEARAYMLLAALSAASFLWFIRVRQDPSRRNIVWWTIFSSLAVMTHFFAGFLVAAEAIWLLRIARSRHVWVGVGVVAVVQVAMFPLAFIDTSHGPQWISAIPRADRIGNMFLEWGVSLLYRRGTNLQGFLGAFALVVAVGLLLWYGRDRRARDGALVAATLVAVVGLVPLLLGLVGQDYFHSRNEIPAFVPVATVVAAACAARRARLFGGLLALVLLGMFTYATIHVQTKGVFQRPDWRSAAHALGPATVTRAVIATGGTSADPVKLYLPHVNWTQSHSAQMTIREVDIVGMMRSQPLVLGPVSAGLAAVGAHIEIPYGSAVPRKHPPRGTYLVARFRLHQWMIGRFVLGRPMVVSINQMVQLLPRFFQHTPQAPLVFFQRAGR